jgi:predicted TPR repeat methyltransferase
VPQALSRPKNAFSVPTPIELPSSHEIEATVAALKAKQPRFQALFAQAALPRALRFIGLKLWEEGQHAAAAQVLTAAVGAAPEEAALWNDLAGALYAAGRHTEAAACMATSLARNDHQPRGWLFLAMIHNQVKDPAAAERALRFALDIEPSLAEASFSLGLICFEQRRFTEAAERMRVAIANGCQPLAAHACLGQALYLVGDFSGAGAAFAAQAAIEPLAPPMVQKLALIRLLEGVIAGSIDAAIDLYHKTAGEHAEDIAKVTQTAFHLLSGYGHREAALRLGKARLAWAPSDPVQTYLLAALQGESVDRAPDDYLVAYFDHFAEGFDEKLVNVLDYRVPEQLQSLLRAQGRSFPHILDLGCGTGLAGPGLRSLGQHLIGVDLAPRMLAKAKERSVYHALIESEAVAYLEQSQESFDLIFAADVLVYIGDLRRLFAAAAARLKPGGVLAISIETTQAADFVLLPSGRFAQSTAYVKHLANPHFAVRRQMPTTIRLEANKPVLGALFVLEHG